MKKVIKNKKFFVVLLIFGITFAILQSAGTVTKTKILRPLSEFPEQIGDWKLVNSSPLEQNIIEVLGVDDYINYNYKSSNGDFVNLYISYFAAVGVTGTYHSPLNCMPGGGVKILNEETVEIKEKKKIKKLTLEMNQKINMTYYWYYTRGRTISSEYIDKIYLVLDAVFKGRRDGAFVRVITYPKEGTKENSTDFYKFINDISDLLTDYLPGETINE